MRQAIPPATVLGQLAETLRFCHIGKVLELNRARQDWDSSRLRQDWWCCQSLLNFLWGLWEEQLRDDMSEQ